MTHILRKAAEAALPDGESIRLDPGEVLDLLDALSRADAVCQAMQRWRIDSDSDAEREAWDCLAVYFTSNTGAAALTEEGE